MSEAVAFCEACQAGLAESASLGEALDEAGVLVPQEAAIEAKTGGAVRVTGFKTVDPTRLASVPDGVFLEWRRRGWIAPIYAHLFSAASWLLFTELATDVMATRQ